MSSEDVPPTGHISGICHPMYPQPGGPTAGLGPTSALQLKAKNETELLTLETETRTQEKETGEAGTRWENGEGHHP